MTNALPVHRISGVSFTFRAQRYARTYTKLKWLFYRIFLFTLRAQRDARTHTSTTDQPSVGLAQARPNYYSYIYTYVYIAKYKSAGEIC